MLNQITFKTELNEIITIEEIVILFDTLKKKYNSELVSLGLYPEYNKLRKKFIERTTVQRNAELSKLLSEISKRKQEIKINIWKTLSAIENSKKGLKNTSDKEKNLEQIIYEAEQIINVYEKSAGMLERKEKKIMSGKYSRLSKIKSSSNKKTLKRQLEALLKQLVEISTQHNDCFSEYINELENLINKTIITSQSFVKKKNYNISEKKINPQSLIIEENQDEKYKKDFYQYEPNQEDLDDGLIYQLLTQGKYEDEDGTINGLILPNLFTEYEEA